MLENKRMSIQNDSRGNAQVVSDGDFILLRLGSAVGVIQINSQTMKPEQMNCTWWYRDDGDGHIFESGIASTKFEVVNWKLKFGTFDLEWSGASDDWGWLYLHKNPNIKFKITQEKPAHDLDLMFDEIKLRDLPESKPYNNTITIDWP